MSRRWLDPEEAADLGRLDPEAIARVRAEAWPDAANADELHDALVWLGFLSEEEAQAGPGWRDWLAALARERRVARLHGPQATLWIAAERLPQFQALWPGARLEPAIAAPAASAARDWSPEDALVEILRGRLEGLGPVTESALAAPLGLEPNDIAAALAALQTEGFAMRGRFTPQAGRGRMVRAPAARPHSQLYGQAAARRDRAGRRARLPALPPALAAGRGGCPHAGARCARGDRRPARRLRGAGRRLGNRDPAGPHRRVRAELAGRPMPGRADRVGASAAAQWHERTAASAARRPCAPRRSRCWRAVMPRSGRRCRRRRTRPVRARARRRSSTASARTARRSSTSWSKAAACCAPRSRRRSPSWSRSVS